MMPDLETETTTSYKKEDYADSIESEIEGDKTSDDDVMKDSAESGELRTETLPVRKKGHFLEKHLV